MLADLITVDIYGWIVLFMKIELIVVFLERVSLGKMQDAKVFLYKILRKPT